MYKVAAERRGWEKFKMSSERIFDTLQYANRLKAVGVPEKQAEAHAEMTAQIIDDKLATKNDLERTRLGLQTDMERVRSELKKDMEQIRSELKRDMEQIRSELKRDMEQIRSELKLEIKLSEERTNKNIAQMGYKIIVGLGGSLGGMIAVGITVLGFLIKVH